MRADFANIFFSGRSALVFLFAKSFRAEPPVFYYFLSGGTPELLGLKFCGAGGQPKLSVCPAVLMWRCSRECRVLTANPINNPGEGIASMNLLLSVFSTLCSLSM